MRSVLIPYYLGSVNKSSSHRRSDSHFAFHCCIEFPSQDLQMADAAAVVHPCLFRWDIFNPFVPLRTISATFYHGPPTETKWEVTFQPTHRQVNFWVFALSFNCVSSGERDEIIAVERIEVDISINGKTMSHEEELNYRFLRTNLHTYEFEANVLAPPRMDNSPHLVIDVRISFPNQNIENRGNGLVFDDFDLTRLSQDMRRLFDHPHYSNFRLRPTNTLTFYLVHSCILQVRWSNFFREHPAHTFVNNTVEIDISDELLRLVLIYMYAGTLHTAGPNWRNPPFMTELFQVIDRYKLHHFYKVFARDESRQIRRTRNHLNISTRNFRLDGNDGRPLVDPSYTWHVNPDTAYEFIFKFKFFLNVDDPCFEYSLQSRSPFIMHAQVNLEYKKRFVGRRRIKVRSVHECDYSIGPNESVESGTCRFVGNSDDLKDFIKGETGIRIQHSISCVLYLSDGTTVIQVESDDAIEFQDVRERFDVLSNHMFEILNNTTQQDLRVACRADWPVNPMRPDDIYYLHKSIFTARVPYWWDVVQNAPQGILIPDVVTCILSSEVFIPVLSYIYTGKSFRIPVHYLDEVDNFAVRGGFNSLRNFVVRMRVAELNL
ncbi:hypothetical protein AVEN_75169-1 [Araneus ventricosus]|uniref:BTB domain-containing protein n=1 Tax=Araneus ventricosus TaxID=182803 RepID=A0A4Y2V3T8_ARAVE|nr:hypothetical protein AVEN_75169-1 [Araneus ventricosus]